MEQSPALARTLKRLRIFGVSSVQIEQGPDGKPIPSASSKPVDLVGPLKYCLDKMEEYDDARAAQHAKEDRRQAKAAMIAAKKAIVVERIKAERTSAMIWSLVIIGMIVAGGLIIALLIVFRN